MSINITPAIMNGACSVAKTSDDVLALTKTPIGAVLVGSITLEARDGNPEPRWYPGTDYSLNSFGMPNGGYAYYEEHLPEMIEIAHSHDKKFVLSIAGFNADEYGKLAGLADKSGVDYIELNLGCPNVSIDGKQKPIASFDQEYITEILDTVISETKKPLFVKLSPYSNPAELKAVANVLSQYGTIAAVVTSNTFPNSYTSVEDQPVLANVYGGMSGKAMQPIALGQVKQFRDALPENIAVIGVGGVETKEDVEQFIAAGAGLVQAATLIVRDGHKAIGALV